MLKSEVHHYESSVGKGEFFKRKIAKIANPLGDGTNGKQVLTDKTRVQKPPRNRLCNQRVLIGIFVININFSFKELGSSFNLSRLRASVKK